jgi:hypothetical protein
MAAAAEHENARVVGDVNIYNTFEWTVTTNHQSKCLQLLPIGIQVSTNTYYETGFHSKDWTQKILNI